MRIFSASLILMLIGCSAAPAIENKVASARAADQIECALDYAADFARVCAIERHDGRMFTLRHGDGGFRRLMLEDDSTVATGDGADPVAVRTLGDGRAEISVGGDRYRLPATR